MCPIAPDTLWALDLRFDGIADSPTLKLLNMVDEFPREGRAIVVGRRPRISVRKPLHPSQITGVCCTVWSPSSVEPGIGRGVGEQTA